MTAQFTSLMRQSAGVGLLLAVLLVSTGTPAAAQGLFDFLFGSWSAKKAPPVGAPPRSVPRRDNGATIPSSSNEREGERYSRGGGSRFRTVCVRLCDGYYWPVSQNASRSEFHRDAEKCRSQCVNEARLYYMPSPGADVATAVDLAGLAYPSLNTAYLYRKERIAGCVCRPVPWSAAERDRHRAYVVEDAAQRRAEQNEARENARLTEQARTQAPEPTSAPDVVPASGQPADQSELIAIAMPWGRHHLTPAATDDEPDRKILDLGTTRQQVLRGRAHDQSRSVDPG